VLRLTETAQRATKAAALASGGTLSPIAKVQAAFSLNGSLRLAFAAA